MNILVTGAAGFIGFHVTLRLLEQNHHVFGADNLNDYYDVSLKKARLALLQKKETFSFFKLDLHDRDAMATLFSQNSFDAVIHLGAQAGVRYSFVNPKSYIDSNLVGTANILEGCRQGKVSHLVFGSSSSVYGMNPQVPFSVRHMADHPISLYAATKRSGELMAHAYSHAHGLPVTCLRFFTVYGPWGRPDMAMFVFTKAILNNEPIAVYNFGDMKRSFTYIDDAVSGIIGILEHYPQMNATWKQCPACDTSLAPYRIYNVGNETSVTLSYLIELLEKNLGKVSQKHFLPLQAGDVEASCADISELKSLLDFQPLTAIEDGVENFIRWYREYYL